MKLQFLSTRHDELLDNMSRVERLTSGGEVGSLVSMIRKTAERTEEAWHAHEKLQEEKCCVVYVAEPKKHAEFTKHEEGENERQKKPGASRRVGETLSASKRVKVLAKEVGACVYQVAQGNPDRLDNEQRYSCCSVGGKSKD